MGEENVFPGGGDPPRPWEKIFRNVGQEEVHYNQAAWLSPRKSVAHLAKRRREIRRNMRRHCASCARTGLSEQTDRSQESRAAANMEKERAGTDVRRICQGVPLPLYMVISAHISAGIQPKRERRGKRQ